MSSVGEIFSFAMAFLTTLSHQHCHESDSNLVTFYFWAGSAGWIALCIFIYEGNDTCEAAASNVGEVEYAYFIKMQTIL